MHPRVTARVVGREVTPETEWSDLREEMTWIGKPWRRIEMLTLRHFFRGEVVETDRTVTFHVGSRRFGVGVTLILGRGHYDYSEERP